MKRRILRMLVLTLALMVILSRFSKASPMDTAWTYQGRLMDANNPADGLYDLQFALFTDPNLSSSQIGPTVEVNDIDIIDGYFTVELDFGSSVFNGDARWLEIGIRPWDSEERYTLLSPRQEVTPTPYSLYAANADTDNDWTIFGSNMYSIPTGMVGIGTSFPSSKLHVEDDTATGVKVTISNKNNSSSEALYFGNDAGITVWKSAYSIDPGKWRFFNNRTSGQYDWITSGSIKMTLANNGNLGIGTTNPGTGLHLKGTGWPDAFITLQSDPNQDTGIRLNEGVDVSWHIFNESSSDGLSIRNASYSSILFAEQDTGDIGLGTTNPRTDLEIKGTTGVRVTTGQLSSVYGDFRHDYSGGLIINSYANGGGWADMSLQTNSTTRMFIESGGNVGIGMGTEAPPKRLTVRGNILVQSSSGANVAEIGEGLDYAEGFNVTVDADIEAGAVLVIDSDNPGKLKVSRSAYDSKVAGIVAGAKGLGSGVRLGIGQFDYDVALAGRVYCNVDATETAVRAGDLLTTSDMSGYAMKATDYDRARGAILGKAMQELEQGQKGQILVLVTLQ
jgi:hypothetical protein